MLGLLVIIVISWLLLHFIEKENINVLGIIPTRKNITQFIIGLIFLGLSNLLNIYFETIVKSIEWKSNPFNFHSIYNAFIYHFKSVLTEDLVFRGAILYILISKLGAKWALFLSAIIFGVYHVFSYGILEERIILIIYVIMVTGATGYVWAYAFYKTNSIMLGLGFHIGINMVNSFFFPSQAYGELLFSEISRISLTGWNEFYFSIFKGLFPSIMTFLFVKFLLRFEIKNN